MPALLATAVITHTVIMALVSPTPVTSAAGLARTLARPQKRAYRQAA